MSQTAAGKRLASQFTISHLQRSGGELSGTVRYDCTMRSFLFTGMSELVERMDLCLDEQRLVPSTMRMRTFVNDRGATDRNPREEGVSVSKADKAFGPPTFVVHVQFRQNATWQGTIAWLEGEQEANFRSTMEMLHLMEGVVAQHAPDPDGSSAPVWSKKPKK